MLLLSYALQSSAVQYVLRKDRAYVRSASVLGQRLSSWPVFDWFTRTKLSLNKNAVECHDPRRSGKKKHPTGHN